MKINRVCQHFTHKVPTIRVEQASAGITLERVQERFARHPAHLQKASNGNTAERFIDVGKLTINGTTSIEGLGIDIKNLPAGKGDSDKSTENGDGNGGSRQLQTSCASSSSVDVASSVFPLMEGCHSASTDTSGNEIIYFSTTSLVVALPLSDDADAEVSTYYIVHDSLVTPTAICNDMVSVQC